MKKVLIVLLSLTMIGTLLFTGCGSSQPTTSTTAAVTSAPAETTAPAPARINVVYHPTIGGSTAIATAINNGYFEEQNLDVHLQMYTSGPPEIASMVAGQADVGFIGFGAAWLAFNGQVNIIALDNLAQTEHIITRADSGIKTIKDLAGKTIAVQQGAAGYTLLLVALKENGMSVNDVKVLNMSNDNLPSTYKDTSIDAWAGWLPSMTSLETALGGKDKFTLLANNASYPEYMFPCVWVANKDFIAKNPDVAQRFVTALTKAQVFRAQNPQQACAFASTYAQQATNDLTGQLPTVVFPTLDDFDKNYNTDAFVKMLTNLRETQKSQVKENLDMNQVVVDKFAKQAVETLKSQK